MSEFRDRTLTLGKHEMVVDRNHEIHITTWRGIVISVEGLPDDWDYTTHDVEEDNDEG